MQSYQSIGIIFGIIGIIFGLLFSITPTGNIATVPSAALGVWVLIISIAGICVVLADTRHSRRVSMVLIFLGAFGNVLLIIPGIMAYRYKPKGKQEIEQQSMSLSDREKRDKELEDTRKKLADLEREKEIRDREEDKK
jgi:hypothetical protein